MGKTKYGLWDAWWNKIEMKEYSTIKESKFTCKDFGYSSIVRKIRFK